MNGAALAASLIIEITSGCHRRSIGALRDQMIRDPATGSSALRVAARSRRSLSQMELQSDRELIDPGSSRVRRSTTT
jgi:hypothetical protein